MIILHSIKKSLFGTMTFSIPSCICYSYDGIPFLIS